MELKSIGFKEKVFIFFKIFALLYVLIIITGILMTFLDEFILKKAGVSIHQLIINQQSKHNSGLSIYWNFFRSCLIAPIIEETIFRLPLKLNKWNIAISLSTFSLFFFNDITASNLFTYYSLFRIISAILILVFFYHVKKEFKLSKTNFQIYFLILTSVFALIHIFNFYKVIPVNLILISFLYVFPQFYLGLFCGYLRLKNGFLWSIFLHSIYNSIALLLIFIATQLHN